MYQLYVRAVGRWLWICDLEAEGPAEALRRAIACLPPEHYDKPIRLEPAGDGGTGLDPETRGRFVGSGTRQVH